DSHCAITHGTGHGVGLSVHEPPLLDMKGPELVAGDVVTVEPGLYRKDLGGVRLEDIVVVTQQGCENLNRLHEGLDWT
ncbi:MAG: M24 family metallopeptidase, partial [Thermoguttaceae bacterium]